MEIADFIENLKDVFENTNPDLLTSGCEYKQLSEWGSLVALSIIAMVDEEYDIQIKGDDIQQSATIAELFAAVIKRLKEE